MPCDIKAFPLEIFITDTARSLKMSHTVIFRRYIIDEFLELYKVEKGAKKEKRHVINLFNERERQFAER